MKNKKRKLFVWLLMLSRLIDWLIYFSIDIFVYFYIKIIDSLIKWMNEWIDGHCSCVILFVIIILFYFFFGLWISDHFVSIICRRHEWFLLLLILSFDPFFSFSCHCYWFSLLYFQRISNFRNDFGSILCNSCFFCLRIEYEKISNINLISS